MSEEGLSNCEKVNNSHSTDVIREAKENDLSGQQQKQDKKRKFFSNKTVRGGGVSLFPTRRYEYFTLFCKLYAMSHVLSWYYIIENDFT